MVLHIGIFIVSLIYASNGEQYRCDNSYSAYSNAGYCVLNDVYIANGDPSCRIQFPSNPLIMLNSAHINHLTAQLMYRMPNVTKLYVSSGNVAKVYVKPELKYLIIAKSGLTELEIDKNEQYGLQELRVSKNELTQLPDNIDNLKKVTLIDLSQNSIEFIDMSHFNGLMRLSFLNLTLNIIKIVHASTSVHLVSLEYLYLQRNNIISMDVSRWNMPSLGRLDISGNNLKRLDATANELPALSLFTFYGNPWDCEWRNQVVSSEKNPIWMSLGNRIDCQLPFAIPASVTSLRNEIDSKQSLKTIIQQFVDNTTTRSFKFDDIIDNLFCRIVGEE